MGKDTVLVIFAGEKSWVESKYSDSTRIVNGQIGFISWQTPLPGEKMTIVPPSKTGICLNLAAKSPFSCPKRENAEKIFRAFKNTGFNAECVADVKSGSSLVVGEVVLLVFVNILATEEINWSLDKLYSSQKTMQLLADAAAEGVDINNRAEGGSIFRLAKFLFYPFVFRRILDFIPKVFNYDMEAYLKFHFTKVGLQMKNGLNAKIEQGAKFSIPTKNLSEIQNMKKVQNWGIEKDEKKEEQ